VTAFDVPDGVRVDTAIWPGVAVPPFYDSLVAKLIVHGPDRGTAVDRLADALDHTRLEGVDSNLDLLAAVVAEPAFRSGDLNTAFLEDHDLVGALASVDARTVAAAAAARSVAPSAVAAAGGSADPWAAGGPWRIAGVGERTTWIAGGRHVEATATRTDEGAVIAVDGVDFVARGASIAGEGVRLELDGEPVLVRPATHGRWVDRVEIEGRTHRLRLAPPPSADRAASDPGDAGSLTAPMPGRIVRIHVRDGDRVAANDPLLVLEAMKMEHVIAASGAGRVGDVLVAVGDQVARGAPLVRLDTEATA
jgi:3-methylcrotonyl-CoA carboxylase alpha subunit